MRQLAPHELEKIIAKKQVKLETLREQVRQAMLTAVSHYKDEMTEEEVEIWTNDCRRVDTLLLGVKKVWTFLQQLEALQAA